MPTKEYTAQKRECGECVNCGALRKTYQWYCNSCQYVRREKERARKGSVKRRMTKDILDLDGLLDIGA